MFEYPRKVKPKVEYLPNEGEQWEIEYGVGRLVHALEPCIGDYLLTVELEKVWISAGITDERICQPFVWEERTGQYPIPPDSPNPTGALHVIVHKTRRKEEKRSDGS